ncbi:MAG: hypothetical protein HZA19_02755 [Nitrospirae bacterium]|nr:hypothetical protein [Nitrospirota bacterium]
MKKTILCLVILSLAVFCSNPTAEARHLKVYGYMTPKAGESELVYWTDYVIRSDNTMSYFGKTGVDREGLFGHTIEVEYGVTDHWTIAGYLDYEQPSGEDFKYIQTRAVVSRYRFFEKGHHFFDGAVYLEYYIPDPAYAGAKEKLEARIILEKDLGRAVLILNPILEKVLSGADVEEGLEVEYGAGLYLKTNSRLNPGLEIYGKGMGELVNFKSSDQQKHYIVPVLKWKLTDRLGWNIGLAFGLTDAADDLIAKSILEWEL